MAAGSTLYIRGKLNQPRRNANGTLGCTSGHVVLKGDIRYLDDYETQLEATTLRFDYQFIHLFNHENLSTGKSYIYDVSELIIPYTNMRDFCYTAMFRKCDKITKSPVFKPAYNSGSYSTWQTFDGCSSLSEITWLSQYGAFSDDFATGVASTGTFYKHPNASYTVSSIPGLSSGWTIQNAQIN